MRSEFRWATATKGSERERPLSEVSEPGSTGLLPQATITPRPQFWLPGGSQVGPFLRLLAETRFTLRASTSLGLPSVLASPVAEGDELSFPPAP